MPYRSLSDLPKSVTTALPSAAQEIYLKAYNNAWEEYGRPEKRRGGASLEATAARVAWAAVKKVYEKDSNTGKWKPSRARS
jgi:cation transport regulator